MLIGSLFWLWLAQDGFGENAAIERFAICIWLVEMSVAVMEAFQHLKRSTVF